MSDAQEFIRAVVLAILALLAATAFLVVGVVWFDLTMRLIDWILQ